MKRLLFCVLLIIFMQRPFLQFLWADQSKTELKGPITPVPCLYNDWKKATLSGEGTDEEAKNKAESVRPRFLARKDPDPFCHVLNMTEAERKQHDEWILWENDEIMVLADKFNWQSPLVIPKSHIIFPFEAKNDLLHRLAIVAAFTSDAMKHSESDRSSNAKIYISPPDGIGVGHLHIHVQLQSQINATNKAEFFNQISSYLKPALVNINEISKSMNTSCE